MKWFLRLIAILLIAGGIVSGFYTHKTLNAKSYVRGSISIENEFYQESFKYASTAIALVKTAEDNVYRFNEELLPVVDFNGVEKNYITKLNENILLNEIYNYGSFDVSLNFKFLNTDGSQKASAVLKIQLTFLSDKTILNLSVEGLEEKGLVEKYITNNGFLLEIKEIKEIN